MAVTVTVATASAVAQKVTRPILLIEIGWTNKARLSTSGSLIWNDLAWSGSVSVDVSGLTADGTVNPKCSIRIDNSDYLFGTIALGNSTDARVRVWAIDGSAMGGADPVLKFDGAIDSASVADDYVTFKCAGTKSRAAVGPGERIGASTGFNILLPPNSEVKIGVNTRIIKR